MAAAVTEPNEDGLRRNVSLACRRAALSFMSGTLARWRKLDLALWLMGPYALATVRPRHEGLRALGELDVGNVGDDPSSLTEVVASARMRVVTALERAVLEGGALAFVERVVQRGLVRRIKDSQERPVWLPVDLRRVGLRERVESLFVADYLNEPRDYAELYVCHACENVVFDVEAQRRGRCDAHVSGFRAAVRDWSSRGPKP